MQRRRLIKCVQKVNNAEKQMRHVRQKPQNKKQKRQDENTSENKMKSDV